MESNKVKLPKEVAEAIEHLRNQDWTDYYIVVKSSDSDSNIEQVATINNWLGRTTGDFDTEEEKGTTHLMIALVNGYEVEQTPENKVREFFDKMQEIRNLDQVNAVLTVLRILNINIKGVNAE